VIKSEWGTKHTCGQCGAPFYDMRRRPVECPKCGAVAPEGKAQKPRRSVAPPEIKPETKAPSKAKQEDKIQTQDNNDDTGGGADKPVVKKDAANEVGDEILEPVEGGEEDDGVIEDASDIGESDDDLSEVLEHVDEAVADNT